MGVDLLPYQAHVARPRRRRHGGARGHECTGWWSPERASRDARDSTGEKGHGGDGGQPWRRRRSGSGPPRLRGRRVGPAGPTPRPGDDRGAVGRGWSLVILFRRWSRRTASRRLARWRRLFTVPTGVARARAVSSSDHPSRWRHTTTARWRTSRSARARMVGSLIGPTSVASRVHLRRRCPVATAQHRAGPVECDPVDPAAGVVEPADPSPALIRPGHGLVHRLDRQVLIPEGERQGPGDVVPCLSVEVGERTPASPVQLGLADPTGGRLDGPGRGGAR